MAFIETGTDGTNFERAFAARPDVYAAWRQLVDTVRGNLDLRRYELITLAAALRLRSSYCSLAHGAILAGEHFSADEVRAIATDHRAAGLDEVDVALMDLAGKIADDATTVDAADVERLRALGLTDTDILDAVLAATVRCFFSKTLDALGALPDAKYADLDPALRDVLTVGRPIDA